MIFITGGAFQGKCEYAEKNYGNCNIVRNYHLIVKEQLKAGKDPIKEAEKFINENADCVVTSDEMGCGIVPINKFEREYREVNGRVNCLLAKKAQNVVRVVCGIGSIIK